MRLATGQADTQKLPTWAGRHGGFAYLGNGMLKASARVWIDGVPAPRADAPEEHTASFEVSQNLNEWWVEAWVDAASATSTVQTKIHDG